MAVTLGHSDLLSKCSQEDVCTQSLICVQLPPWTGGAWWTPWNFPGKNTGVGCATLGDLPDPGIEPVLPVSPALTGRLFTTVLSERPRRHSGKHA